MAGLVALDAGDGAFGQPDLGAQVLDAEAQFSAEKAQALAQCGLGGVREERIARFNASFDPEFVTC